MVSPVKKMYWDLARALGLSKPPTDPQQIFSNIYREGVWGKKGDFFSGEGSHDRDVVEPYVDAMRGFLKELGTDVDIVDIGCGDFHVGSQLMSSVRTYVACDIVPTLIASNRKRYQATNLRFEVINAITDEVPEGTVVCIRQVLQHLSNEHIGAVLGRLHRFKHWVITEHIPAAPGFSPNGDKKTGGDVRLLHLNSGVVLTEPPFSITPVRQRVICQVSAPSGGHPAWIRTIVYSF